MLRMLMLAVVPVLALSGAVRAEDAASLNDFAGESSFEVDALTAAFDDETVVGDLEVAPVAGSQATEEIDAEAACFGFGYRAWGYGYRGWRGFRTWNSCYRPYGYGGYGFGGYGGFGGWGGYCYRPVFRSYCW